MEHDETEPSRTIIPAGEGWMHAEPGFRPGTYRCEHVVAFAVCAEESEIMPYPITLWGMEDSPRFGAVHRLGPNCLTTEAQPDTGCSAIKAIAKRDELIWLRREARRT